MFYAQTSYGENMRFAAFETEREAAEWVVSELGDDYEEHFWVDQDGALYNAGRAVDFSAEVHSSAQAAIEAQAGLDPDAAVWVLRILLDVIERAEG